MNVLLAGVGLGIVLAFAAGNAYRRAVGAGRAVRKAEAELPGMRDARAGARFGAGFWLAVVVGYVVLLVLWQTSE